MSEIIHAFMRRQPGFDIGAPEAPPRKANRSTLRTGAIVAGGAGLAYGGVKVGRAAGAVKKAAVAAEAASHKHAAAMESAGKVAGGVGRVGKKLKKIFRFEKVDSAGSKTRKREKVQPAPSAAAIAAQAAAGGLLVKGAIHPALGLKKIYHGTSERNWRDIRTEGLDPSKGGGVGGSGHHVGSEGFKKQSAGKVHVTGIKPIAKGFADLREGKGIFGGMMKGTNVERGKVVGATVSHADFKKFQPDPDMSKAGPEPLRRRVASTTTQKIHASQIHGSAATLGAKIRQRGSDMRRGIGASPRRTLAGMAGVAAGGYLLGGAAKKIKQRMDVPKALSSLRKVVTFAAPTVSKDRYVKGIHEKDADRAGSHYVRSAGAGALLGLGLRKGSSRKIAALKGAVAGIGAQAVTRGVSSATKDVYGDRTPGGKFLDKLPAAGLLAGGIAVGVPRLRKKFPKVAARITKFSRREALMHGAALAGGIAVADGVTGAIRPGKDTRREAATEGLKRGAIYGGALAVAEPAIMAALRRAGCKGKRRPAIVKLSSRGKVISFRGRQQLFTDDNPGNPSQYADPIKGASGEQRVYTRDEKGNKNPEVPTFRHAQVLKAAYNKGRDIHKWGGRSARVTSDVGDMIRGKKKVDERGRPLKREWEKSYFRNAVGGAVAGAALLAHHRAYRDHPKYRANVKHYRKKFRDTVNNAVPGAFNNLSARGRTFVFARGPQGRLIAFDYSAADWDVRDQRGRSARVFAPGARARDRREKHWHEKTSNMKKLAVVSAVLAAAGGGAAGFRLGKTRGVKIGRQATAMKAAAARKARAAKVASDVAAGAAAEDAAIKRMPKRPPVSD